MYFEISIIRKSLIQSEYRHNYTSNKGVINVCSSEYHWTLNKQ